MKFYATTNADNYAKSSNFGVAYAYILQQES